MAINAIQRYAIEHSRLGIPILFGEECSHGHMAIGATVFPVPILLGSMWNVELYRRMCEAIAARPAVRAAQLLTLLCWTLSGIPAGAGPRNASGKIRI